MPLDPRGLGSGTHRVQVLATDIDGQATLSSAVVVEGRRHAADGHDLARAGGHGVSVRIRDRELRRREGRLEHQLRRRQRVAKHVRARHRYARAGVYTVVVHVRDRAGNQATVRRLVSVR